MADDKLQEEIKKLEEKLKQKKALAAEKAARERRRENERLAAEARREDTRKKVLLGAFIMDISTKQGQDLTALNFMGVNFQDWLTREDDRALFGLAQKPAEEPRQ
jgi:hypothetical protein